MAVEAVTAVLPFPVADPERCAECGFDGSTLWPADAARALAGLGAVAASRRPRRAGRAATAARFLGVWSPLEYAAPLPRTSRGRSAGVRQGAVRYAVPDGPPPDPDEVAEAAGYSSLDPAEVVQALGDKAARWRCRAGRAAEGDWFRSGALGGEVVTAIDLLRHAVHDAAHHLMDVDRQLGG